MHPSPALNFATIFSVLHTCTWRRECGGVRSPTVHKGLSRQNHQVACLRSPRADPERVFKYTVSRILDVFIRKRSELKPCRYI